MLENTALSNFDPNLDFKISGADLIEQIIITEILLGSRDLEEIFTNVQPEYFLTEGREVIFRACLSAYKRLSAQSQSRKVSLDPLLLREELKLYPDLQRYIDEHVIHAPMPPFHLVTDFSGYYSFLKKRYIEKTTISNLERCKPKILDNSDNILPVLYSFINETEQLIGGSLEDASFSLHEATSELIEKEIKKFKGEADPYVKTGFKLYDNVYGGLRPSDLIILAARPGMGKTSFATKIALNAVKNNCPTFFISLEMSREQIVNRCLALESGISSSKGLKHGLTQSEIEKHIEICRRFAEYPLIIYDKGGSSLERIHQKASYMKKIHNIKLLIVDYLQIISVNSQKYENRVQTVSEISAGLKNIAKDLNIPVIALSQLSRSVESRADKTPLLSDLRDSGTIEQDADLVMFLYREEYYKKDDPNIEGLCQLLVKKNRHDALHNFNFRFDKSTTNFKELNHV
jgi:replicative DNA helicase